MSQKSNLPSSPMMMGDQEIKRSLSYNPRANPYCIRFTPVSQDGSEDQVFSYDEVLDEFLDNSDIPITVYLITEEQKPKVHFHIYLESSLNLEDMKAAIREFIYKYYPERKRGFGTKQYNCLVAENPLNAIIYALKQRGRYAVSGFTEEFIDECRKLSFVKTPTDFDEELSAITTSFLDSNKDPYVFAEELVILYATYDKRVHFKDIQGYVNSKLIKRDPSIASYLVRKNLTF